MSAPLDELYFQWLYKQVAAPEFHDKDLTYWKLLKVLYQKEFFWDEQKVPNDENRAGDGTALRGTFLMRNGISSADPEWLEMGCSMLEMLIALARRIEFEVDSGSAYFWFWTMLDNIGLAGYSDERRFTKRLLYRIDSILEDVINRNYEPSGLGGLFPLRETRYDQRERELLYQMSEFIMEHRLAG